MGLYLDGVEYDRARVLEAAEWARSRKKLARAIELYRWALTIEPEDAEIHGRLAPLLAETGQDFDAWISFRSFAQAHLSAGQPDRALAIYGDAALYLPKEMQAWQALGQLQAKRGFEREAIETLLVGSRQFRAERLRPQAIYLLRCAREIDLWSFEVVVELARLLALQQQERESRILFDGLIARFGGERLRRVRATQLRLHPTPASIWSWLRAALSPAPEPAQAEPKGRPAGVVPIRKRSARR